MMNTTNIVGSKKIGSLLREWRKRRRLSQLDLAYNAEISQRHLSFIELGRSQPSREMILRLAEQLEVPLRERNILLSAAGLAAVFPERSFADKSLDAARKIVDVILKGIEPYPSFLVDRHWTLVAANKAADIMLRRVDPSLLEPPVNVLRLFLHPKGFTPQIINYTELRRNILEYLDRQIELTADSFLMNMARELKTYPKPKLLKDDSPVKEIDYSRIAVPLRMMTEEGELSFIGTVTVFGTPIDVTLSELAIESFFPANEKTAEILNRIFKQN